MSASATGTTTATATKTSGNGKEVPKNEATKRLHKELMDLMGSGTKGISAFPEGDTLFRWIATIEGPIGTLYDGLKFKLTMEFPPEYPFFAPIVKFKTTCFHPNIDGEGNIW